MATQTLRASFTTLLNALMPRPKLLYLTVMSLRKATAFSVKCVSYPLLFESGCSVRSHVVSQVSLSGASILEEKVIKPGLRKYQKIEYTIAQKS
mmetsp:Transcript_12884/g.19372  ORF Transcript_12884/g.19372 Transcript_12884/m.19372 type:complete len:94 (+) Transcript_12884:144-425(+)